MVAFTFFDLSPELFLPPFFGDSGEDSPSVSHNSMWQGEDMYGLILPWARYVLRLKQAALFTYKMINLLICYLNRVSNKHRPKQKQICVFDNKNKHTIKWICGPIELSTYLHNLNTNLPEYVLQQACQHQVHCSRRYFQHSSGVGEGIQLISLANVLVWCQTVWLVHNGLRHRWNAWMARTLSCQ